ncbi:electron transfer flavoprotein subunit beta/FixA family protein [bacterium]|nr:electron transfer flavoprotein subunit beta/FixA family protein [bacterium]MBU1599450.1 electron transfer flavoprotein subunit beta/FixA family protein [bacterium]MBU2461426.1 electron transfer flavoprotein subunit beta/FixA family protein [bacterium]
MRIIVCIKQVPETGNVKIDPKTNTLIREGISSIINPFDQNAIEAGVELKERYGGEVITITMGPPQAEEALREAISLGADSGFLITDRLFAGSDTLATAYTLSRAIKKIGDFDLIICGKQAIDGDTAQTGPEVAEMLGIPHISYVCESPVIDEKRMVVKRELENGIEVLEAKLPALITVTKEANQPRLPSLKRKLLSKKAEILKLSASDIDIEPNLCGLTGSATGVIQIFAPPKREGRTILSGTPEEIVKNLISQLRECNYL